jgi:hypothetical protein
MPYPAEIIKSTLVSRTFAHVEAYRDYRYQLTVIGQFTQAMVAEKIRGNRFVIKTDKPKVEVSWQVTGIRKDALARFAPMQVEAEKPKEERGKYLAPEAYGKAKTSGIHFQAPPEEEKNEMSGDEDEPEKE